MRGVRLADGTEVTAAAVVTTCDPASVASRWLPEPTDPAARRFVDRARTQVPGEGYQSKIDAVVTEVPRYPALEDSDLLDLFEGRATQRAELRHLAQRGRAGRGPPSAEPGTGWRRVRR